MHLHTSALQGLIIFLFVLIFGFLWRVTTMKMSISDNDAIVNIASAMAVLY